MKTHRTDGLSLGFGLMFLATAAWWLFGRMLRIPLPALGWVVAAALIGFGLVGLVGAVRGGRSAAQPVDNTSPPPDGGEEPIAE